MNPFWFIAVLTKCEQMKLKAEGSGLLGVKIPQCEDDGSFIQIQSWEGYQWCVDENGIELLGTRVEPGETSPNCSKGLLDFNVCFDLSIYLRFFAVG